MSENIISAETEKNIIYDLLFFLGSWNAHGQSLQADCKILHNRFIVVSANESQYSASGCSIDKQVHFVLEIEKKYALNLFNRLLVACKKDQSIFVFNSAKTKELLLSGELTEHSLIFNLAVSTDIELETKFLIPIKDSWLRKYLEITLKLP